MSQKGILFVGLKKDRFQRSFSKRSFEAKMLNLFEAIAALSVDLAQGCTGGTVDDLRVRYNVVA